MSVQTVDKITKAKIQLILKQPFFATLALNMEFIEDKTIETASTNGKYIKYNPEFINSLPPEHVEALLAHEVMHPACLHHTRQGARNHDKWNMAADYAINPLLQESGFKLPDGGLINPAYKGKSAEDIYNLLPDAPKGEGKESNKFGSGFGEVESMKNATEEEVKEAEAQAKQLVLQATTAARQAGKLPESIARMVDEMLNPKLPWEEILNRFISEIAYNDYNWNKPSKRYITSGFYMPSLESKEKGNIVLIVDTSGSIDRKMLNEFGAELYGITSIMNLPINVLYVDASVQGTEELEDCEPLHPIGGGGTDYKPGYKHIDKHLPDTKAVVYFTDGYCDSFPKHEPDYPTIWAVHGTYDFKPPFGEVIHIQ